MRGRPQFWKGNHEVKYEVNHKVRSEVKTKVKSEVGLNSEGNHEVNCMLIYLR